MSGNNLITWKSTWLALSFEISFIIEKSIRFVFYVVSLQLSSKNTITFLGLQLQACAPGNISNNS